MTDELKCRCRSRTQPYARLGTVGITVGRTLTCDVHNARWVWDGVALIPDRTWYAAQADAVVGKRKKS